MGDDDIKVMTYAELHTRLNDDPAYRELSEDGAFAHAVAVDVIRYRVDRGLHQEDLAEVLGVDLDTVRSLEDGEETPDLKTLLRLSDRLGLRFAITIDPPGDAFSGVARSSHARLAGAVAAA